MKNSSSLDTNKQNLPQPNPARGRNLYATTGAKFT